MNPVSSYENSLDNAPDKCDKKESNIMMRINTIHDNMEKILNGTNRLREKLEPILTPQVSNIAGDDEIKNIPQSEIARYLIQLNSIAENILDIICNTIDRIEC